MRLREENQRVNCCKISCQFWNEDFEANLYFFHILICLIKGNSYITK